MDIIIACQEATVQISCEDAKELTGKAVEAQSSYCLVKEASPEDAATLTYQCQGAHRIGVFLASGSTKDELEQALQDTPELKNLQGESFAVRCVKIDPEGRHPQHAETTVDIATYFGGHIHHILPEKKVDLKQPDTLLTIIMFPTELVCCIDLVGVDMASRPYKVFAHPASVNGVVAYSAARLAGATKESTVLDPFCDCATIPIEIALWQENSSGFLFSRDFVALRYPQFANAFDQKIKDLKKNKVEGTPNIYAFEPQLRVMLQAKKNIKLSGVQDAIACSKVTTDWIDAKFEEQQVDCIVSKPPQISKRTPSAKQIHKIYDELFYQARYILKKEGAVALLMHHPEHLDAHIQKHNFAIQKTFPLWGGKQVLTLVVAKQVNKND